MPFPRTGKKVYFDLQQAVEVIGGDVEFTRLFGSMEAYFPLGRYLNFHPRLAIGGSRPGLPLSEKFYLGGMHSFAGYRTYQLAGDKMWLASAELRLSLPLMLYLSGRYDLGNVYGSADDIKLSNVLHGAGVFLALDSPIGPLEIGYGFSDHDSEQLYVRAGFDF
jgi:NTE family protein